MPFAVDGLRQNPRLIVVSTTTTTTTICSLKKQNIIPLFIPNKIPTQKKNKNFFEATSPIHYTTICKCISIENNGTEVDHTNLDFSNAKHVDFRISSKTKVTLKQYFRK